MHRLIASLRQHWHHLVQLHDTPHSIAGGAAIGTLLGFTPLFSVKTLLAILIAWGFRCSRVSAAVAVTLHDVTLPVAPVLLRIQYGIGYWLLSHPHHWPPKIKLSHFHWEEWFHWQVFVKLVWPMFLGSLVIGIPIAILAFFLTLRIVTQYQEKRRAAAPVAGEREQEPKP